MNLTRILVIHLLVMFGMFACGTTAPPQSMALAESEIEAAKKRDVDSVYPGLIKEADDALKRSKKALVNDDSESADLHAQTARAKVRSAQSLVRRQEAINQAKAMQNSLGKVEGAAEEAEGVARAAKRFEAMQAELEVASRQAQSPKAGTPVQITINEAVKSPPRDEMPLQRVRQTSPSSELSRAEEHVLKVKLARAQALGRGEDATCPENFREAGAVLEIASDELAAGKYHNAFELSVRAEERLSRCLRDYSLGSLTQEPQSNGASPSPVALRAVPEVVAKSKGGPSRQEVLAVDAIAQVQLGLSKLRVKDPNDSRVIEANTLLMQAETWLNQDEFERSLVLARTAQGVLAMPSPAPKEPAPKEPAPEEPAPEEPAPDEKEQDLPMRNLAVVEPEPMPRDAGGWQIAYRTVLDALVARDRAAEVGTDSAAFDRGLAFLGKARIAWRAADYIGAKRFSEAALSDFGQVLGDGEDAQKSASASLRKLDRAIEDCTSCSERAPVEFKGVEVLSKESRREFENSKFGESQRLSDEAILILERVEGTKRKLTFGSNLKWDGGSLQIDPKVDFTTGSANVTPASRGGLEALGAFLRQNPTTFESLEIQGYTDARGNDQKNLELSQKRADSVLRALESSGVNTSQIKAVGYGEINPIASNDTDAGRADNRRVEFRIRWASDVVVVNE